MHPKRESTESLLSDNVVHEKPSTSERETVWLEVIPVKVARLFLMAQVFHSFAHQRPVYLQERCLIFSISDALFFIFLAINSFSIINEVCLNVVISVFCSLLQKCKQKRSIRVAQ